VLVGVGHGAFNQPSGQMPGIGIRQGVYLLVGAFGDLESFQAGAL
jgi:hypothetical protein